MSNNTLTVRVKRKTVEATAVCGVELESIDGGALPRFTAGSHIDVHLPGGLVRQYSLCNSPLHHKIYQIAVLLEPASRGGSKAVHELVLQGDLLEISRPRNLFELEPSPRTLLFAGGIGITPLIAMADSLTLDRRDFELHYCGRSLDRMAFSERINRSQYAEKAYFHFDDGPLSQRLDIVSTLKKFDHDSHLYVCGPQGFIAAVLNAARTESWPEARLHREFFAATAPAHQATDSIFSIRLIKSGKLFAVGEHETVVEVLRSQNIEIPISCEQGICGTCLTRVLEGTPDHRDSFLTDEERSRNDQFTPCCSRSHSQVLVLDL